MKQFSVLISLALSLSPLLGLVGESAQAKVKTEVVEYKQGETALEGYLAYDPTKVKGKKAAGVLVVHDWMGLGAFAKERAERLAEMGYVAFAADIYGKGIRPKSPDAAGQLAGKYKNDRKLMRERILAATQVLKGRAEVDPQRLAVMGYCFGGTVALELARSGADIKGAVSFHGGLSSATPTDAKNIKGKILALHGADDPFVPAKEVAAFEEEMRLGGVDWQLTKYSKAVHAFTNPEAGQDPSKGAAYNAEADRRSWVAMKDFFQEIL